MTDANDGDGSARVSVPVVRGWGSAGASFSVVRGLGECGGHFWAPAYKRA